MNEKWQPSQVFWQGTETRKLGCRFSFILQYFSKKMSQCSLYPLPSQHMMGMQGLCNQLSANLIQPAHTLRLYRRQQLLSEAGFSLFNKMIEWYLS